eukprot:1644454-Alexandrium_andersonii.AAC.1
MDSKRTVCVCAPTACHENTRPCDWGGRVRLRRSTRQAGPLPGRIFFPRSSPQLISTVRGLVRSSA